MAENAVKMVRVSIATHIRLAKQKVHPNQSFEEVIIALLDEKEGKE